MADVTVLMPVYNALPFLPAAVESVFAQTHRDLTLMVIDDGSQDGSLEYLRSLTDPRIQVVTQEHAGLGAALNLGLSLTRTQYLARMDADDLIPPRRLEVQLRHLQDHPQVVAVGSQFCYFHDPARLDSRFSRRLPLEHQPILADLLAGRLAIVHASLVIRTDVFRHIGGYRSMGIGEDWDMFLRLAEQGELANVDEVLYLWRVHSQSVCMRNVAETQLRIAHACDCALRRYQGHHELPFDEFLALRSRRPFWRRWQDQVDYFGAAQYRAAVAELLGRHRWRGTVRMGLAALCSPTRTLNRIARIVRPPASRNPNQSDRTSDRSCKRSPCEYGSPGIAASATRPPENAFRER